MLTLNYLKVAKAAQYCAAYCTSIYYAELWCQEKLKRKYKDNKDQSLTSLELICKDESEDTKALLLNIFEEVLKVAGKTEFDL